ncbi:BTE_collapsed_G0004380.mRNA.1.CDS.1 [Saccharomyces cerevisiae]|nr:BTE_collapsed_G0004380.mRNA.1.CDS.1 [Saccharomyces cerevisiae]
MRSPQRKLWTICLQLHENVTSLEARIRASKDQSRKYRKASKGIFLSTRENSKPAASELKNFDD